MRWEGLFDELERRFEVGLAAEAAAEALDVERARQAERTLRSRCGEPGRQLTVATRGGALVRLVADVVGADWVAGTAVAGGARLLIPFASLAWIAVDPADAPAPAMRERLPLAIALGELARRRATVELLLPGDGPSGTIDRVAADHLDLAVHAIEQPRRPAAVSGVRIVPFAAIDHLRWRR